MKWLATLLLLLLPTTAYGASSAVPPRATVIIAVVEASASDNSTDVIVGVIAGYTKGCGWRTSEQIGSSLKKGDRLQVYASASSGAVVGEVELTDAGSGPSKEWGGWGWIFKGRLSQPINLETPLLAIWRAPGSASLKWIAKTSISQENAVYKREIYKWLASRGIPKQSREYTEVWQIVKADVNNDKREEVFMSFLSPGSYLFSAEHKEKYRYSYLVIRYLPVKSKEVKTLILDENFSVHTVIALCDFDQDRWAEVVVENGGQDYGDTLLYHWNGKKFQMVSHVGGGL